MARHRLAVVVACALGVAGVVPMAAPAAAAPAGTLYTTDSFSPANGQNLQTWSPVTVTTTTAGGVRLLHSSGNSVTLAPPTGSLLSAGDLPVGSPAPTASVGQLVGTFQNCAPPWTGTVHVVDVSYSGTTLQTLAATYDLTCAGAAPGRVAGTIQVADGLTYALESGALSPAGGPQTGVGMQVPARLVVTNQGPDQSTAGVATIGGANASDWAIDHDGCSGVVLDPGASCTVDVFFTPSALGVSNAALTIPTSNNPRAAGFLGWLHGVGVAPPAVPTALAQYARNGGAGLSWSEPVAGPIASYDVYRRPTSADEWTKIGSAQPFYGGPAGLYADQTLSAGASAQYAVAAVGPGGTSALSPALDLTRPAQDTAVGTIDAMAWEDPSGNPAFDVLRGDTLHAQSANGIGSLASMFSVTPADASDPAAGRASATLPVVPGPGTYTIIDPGIATGPGQVHVGYVTDCGIWSGTLTVHDVAYDDSLVPQVYSADLDTHCENSWALHAVIRYHATQTYKAAAFAPMTLALEQPVHVPSAAQAVVLTNRGRDPLTVGTPALTGQFASDYAVSGDDCGATLAVDATCTISVTFTPGGPSTRAATLTTPLDTLAGSRDVSLQGVGGDVPTQPVPPVATPLAGPVYLEWANAGDGGTPILGYHVFRATGAGAPVLIGTAHDIFYTDRTAVAGTTYSYSVAAYSIAGDGPHSTATTVRARSAAIVHIDSDYSGYGQLVVGSSTGGASMTLSDAFPEHATPAVSRDGLWVVYAAATTPGPGGGYDLWKRRLDGSGSPVRLTSLNGDEVDPAWSPNGATIAFTSYAPGAYPAVYVVPAAGGTPALRSAKASEPSWFPDSARLVVTDETTTTSHLAVLSATSVRTAIPNTTDGYAGVVAPDGTRVAFDVSTAQGDDELFLIGLDGNAGTRVEDAGHYFGATWRSDGCALIVDRYVEGLGLDQLGTVPVSGVLGVWTALASQQQYDETEPAWAETDHTAPVPTITSPSVSTTLGLGSSFPVFYTASDALGVQSYDVRYRRASDAATYGAYASPSGWLATTATSKAIALSPGYEYCASVRARDAAGNVSAWTADRCVSSPLDDRSFAVSTGWTRASSSVYYRGTATVTTRLGATMSLRYVQTRRVTFVVTKCPTCGKFSVYLGSTLIGSVNLYSSTTRYKQVAALTLLSSVRGGSFTIRVTSSGHAVGIDGVAFRRV